MAIIKLGYQERVRVQTLSWAMGRPYHNTIDDECCPDFSCCQPELFERDQAKRWQHYSDELMAASRVLGTAVIRSQDCAAALDD